MDKRLHETLAHLWHLAGLGQIEANAQVRPQLVFDDVSLNFESSENGQQLVVSTECGQLDEFGADHGPSFERLLKLGFALLHDHDVLLHVEGGRLRLSAFHSYDTGTTATLASVLSDMVAAAQTVSGLRFGMVPVVKKSPNTGLLDEEQAVIFQP